MRIKLFKEYNGYLNNSGEEFWGDIGAGLLPICTDTKRILIGLRSEYVNEPLTWGIFGGMVDPDENVLETAKREFIEETKYDGHIDLIKAYVFKSPKGGFEYHNFIGLINKEFVPKLDWETKETKWMTYQDLLDISSKHFGLSELLKNSSVLIKRYTI